MMASELSQLFNLYTNLPFVQRGRLATSLILIEHILEAAPQIRFGDAVVVVGVNGVGDPRPQFFAVLWRPLTLVLQHHVIGDVFEEPVEDVALQVACVVAVQLAEQPADAAVRAGRAPDVDRHKGVMSAPVKH